MASAAPKAIAGGSLLVLAGWVAANGKEFAGALTQGLDFIVAVSEKMPFGLYSFLLALGIGVGLLGTLRSAFPEPVGESKAKMNGRIGSLEFTAMAASWAVVILQHKSLAGVLTGMLCALFVPWVYRGLAACVAALRRNWTVG